MKQIRRGVFETNSSSTHAISIEIVPSLYRNIVDIKHMDASLLDERELKIKNRLVFPDSIVFKPGEFGWEEETLTSPEDKASYLLTAMLCLLSYEEFDTKIKEFKRWFDEEGIEMIIPEYECVFESYGSTETHKKYIAQIPHGEDEYFGIDHCNEADEFMCYAIATKANLFSYLFGDSAIKTGNDNDDCDISFYETNDRGVPKDNESWEYKYHHKIFYKGN